MQAGKEILFEGAQGTFLESITAPILRDFLEHDRRRRLHRSGVPPHRMDRVVGVMKAYTTRVGEGPLPTENPKIADMLHGMGREFGATTGRARRCGWFDAVATRYATMVNGIDEIAVTNLDGLDTVETIRVCVAYRLDGKKLDVPPSDAAQLACCQPVYIELPGWKRRLTKPKNRPICRRSAELSRDNRQIDRRPANDDQRRPESRPDDRGEKRQTPSSRWSSSNASTHRHDHGWKWPLGERARVAQDQRARKRRRRGARLRGRLRRTAGEFLTLYAFPRKIGSARKPK